MKRLPSESFQVLPLSFAASASLCLSMPPKRGGCVVNGGSAEPSEAEPEAPQAMKAPRRTVSKKLAAAQKPEPESRRAMKAPDLSSWLSKPLSMKKRPAATEERSCETSETQSAAARPKWKRVARRPAAATDTGNVCDVESAKVSPGLKKRPAAADTEPASKCAKAAEPGKHRILASTGSDDMATATCKALLKKLKALQLTRLKENIDSLDPFGVMSLCSGTGQDNAQAHVLCKARCSLVHLQRKFDILII